MAKKKLQSIGELARLAGVSKSTVSRVLNNNPLIGEQTAARVWDIARKYDFKLNASARRLSLCSSKTIAFVTNPDPSACYSVCDLFTMEILGGLTRGLYELQYDLLLLQVETNDVRWATEYLDTGKVDGFVLMTSMPRTKQLDELLRIGAPFVTWGRSGGRHCSVCGDDRRGGYLATSHLLAKGRRRIAFIGGPPDEIEVVERYQGYRNGLAEAGIDPDPALVTYHDFSETSGAIGMAEVLQRTERVDAVFVNSDLAALSTMAYLRKHGIAVPQDIAVVGYDGLSISSRSVPPLTTVSQNVSMAGKILARDLVAYLKDNVITETVVPVELIERESA